MSKETYILEAYKLSYRFSNCNAYSVTVPEVLLQPLLNHLFISGVTHSRPIRLRGEPLYTVYIAGDDSDAKSIEDFVNGLGKDLRVRSAEVRNIGSVDTLDDSTKLDMAYRAVRQYIYKELGFRRGSGQKLYNTNAVERHEILYVYKVYVTGSDILKDSGYMFIDAARKLEFTTTLKNLEVRDQNSIKRIRWVKISGSTVSFYIEQGIDAKRIGNAVNSASHVLRYIAETRGVPINVEKLSFSEDDIIVLTPRSTKLLQELRARGYTVSIGGNDFALLPKNVLAPVASMDNIASLLHRPIDLKIDPTTRHTEITELVQKLGSGIEIGDVHVALDTEPLRINAGRMPLDKLYIDTASSRNQDIRSVAFSWNPYKLLKNITSSLIIYILYNTDNELSRSAAEIVYNELRQNLKLKPQLLEIDFDNIEDYAEFINKSVGTRKGTKHILVLVIGPSSVGSYEDRRLRDAVERAFRFRGLFCWYISIRPRGRGELGGKKRDVSRMVLNKLRVIMKELAVRPLRFPHKLLSLKLMVSNGEEIVNIIGAADATVVSMEKGQLRVGEALLIMNISRGEHILETDAETSMQGEDAVLAKLVRKVLGYAKESRLVMYVNRARPEALLSYMDEDEAREILNRAVIIGATKTHTYPRILKAIDDHFANPEITTCYHLYTKDVSDMRARVSRYLAITTSAWGENFGEGLTVKPILVSILANKELANPQNIDEMLRYTLTLCILNNTSAWVHSLPWPLHRVDRILKTAHRLAQTEDETIKTFQNKEIVKIL